MSDKDLGISAWDIKAGDILRFAWNPMFGEPSSISDFEVERIVKDDGYGLLYVDIPSRRAKQPLAVKDLMEWFDYYAGEVEPIKIVSGNVQLHLFM